MCDLKRSLYKIFVKTVDVTEGREKKQEEIVNESELETRVSLNLDG